MRCRKIVKSFLSLFVAPLHNLNQRDLSRQRFPGGAYAHSFFMNDRLINFVHTISYEPCEHEDVALGRGQSSNLKFPTYSLSKFLSYKPFDKKKNHYEYDRFQSDNSNKYYMFKSKKQNL